MCCCKTHPTVNGNPGCSMDGKTFYAFPVNPPEIRNGETIVFDGPGRCWRIDAHSHHFRLTRDHGYHYLLVRHGGGDERIELPSYVALDGFDLLDDHGKYWHLHTLYSISTRASVKARDDERARWTCAAVEKRIKVRRRDGRYRVEILPPVPSAASAVPA